MKITESNLPKLIELALKTPEGLMDYCYYDGCVTHWDRGILNHRKNGEYLDYHCSDCGTKRHYNLDRLRKEKEALDDRERED